MCTQHGHPAPAAAPAVRPTGRHFPPALLALVAIALAACSGGKSGKPPVVGTVIVRVTDLAGNPIRDARVALHAGVNSSDPLTNDSGEVVFKDTLAGEREASAAKQGHFAPTRRFMVSPGSVTRLSLVIDGRIQPRDTR